MTGLAIKKESGQVVVLTEEMTKEKVREYVELLKERLDTTLYGICPLFNLKPDDNGCRTIRKWYNTSSVEIPEHHWRMLLVYVHGFKAGSMKSNS